MTKKINARSPILEAVHATASDLHRLGFIDMRKMQRYDLLCLQPVPDYNGAKVKALRAKRQLSQSVLASLLNRDCPLEASQLCKATSGLQSGLGFLMDTIREIRFDQRVSGWINHS